MKKFATTLMLLFWSISTAASASMGMSVVCIEKSGAASFEFSTGDRCVDQDNSALKDNKHQTSVSSAECANCVDSTLSGSVADSIPRIAKKVLAAEPVLVTLAVIKAPVYTQVHGERASPMVELAPVRSDYLAQRTSIVILR